MQRYNLALIPATQQSAFIKFAEQFNDNGKVDYILGASCIPHITLAQFYLHDKTMVETIWASISAQLKQTSNLTLQLRGLNCYFEPTRNDFVWLQLLPEPTVDLHLLHREIVSILNSHTLTAINRSLDNYEPHLTLAHTSNLAYVKQREQYPFTLADHFYLALGESDEIGQLIRVILH